MAPGWQGFFRAVGSTVTCGHVYGLWMRRAWPLALMGTVDRGPIIATGSLCPNDEHGLFSIVDLTDFAITRVHPRKPSVLAGSGRLSRGRRAAEVLVTHHQRPADARHLVGQRHRRHLARLGGEQLLDPGSCLVRLPFKTAVAPLTSRRRK